jgi:hypothetical protein
MGSVFHKGFSISDDVSPSHSFYSQKSWGGSLNQSSAAQVFTSVATYQGKIVSVKRVNKPFIYLTKDIIQELTDVKSSKPV